jgi:hypothetical protein
MHQIKKFGILCYLPPAEMINLGAIKPHQPVLAQQMVKEGLISKKLADKLKRMNHDSHRLRRIEEHSVLV